MANLAPIGVQAGADASVSDLLAHWIAEQQQRDDLCRRERPRIGILAAQGHLRDGGWPAYGGDAPTVQAILEAGGFPYLIPTLPLIEGYDPLQLLSDDHAFALLFEVLWPVVRELDGLILTGGGDLSSCLFGKPPHPQTETSDAWRDVWERYVARLSWLLCIPTLGVCRGMQLMNVALGRNALPGPASRVAEGAATTAAPPRERQGLLLELGQPPHPTGAARQSFVVGGAREGYTRSAISGCGAVHASPGGGRAGARPGNCRHIS